jgi:hypothetical protein
MLLRCLASDQTISHSTIKILANVNGTHTTLLLYPFAFHTYLDMYATVT